METTQRRQQLAVKELEIELEVPRRTRSLAQMTTIEIHRYARELMELRSRRSGAVVQQAINPAMLGLVCKIVLQHDSYKYFLENPEEFFAHVAALYGLIEATKKRML